MQVYCDSFLKLVETYRFLPMNSYYSCSCCYLVTQSCLTLSDPTDCSTPGFPVFHFLPELAQTYVHWVSDALHPTISSSVVPFSSCLQSFSASGSFPMSQFFALGCQSIAASASVPPVNIQGWFPLGLTSYLLADQGTLKSSPAPPIESISSSAISLLYGQTLTSIHDYWKNRSFDCTDLCQQSNVSAF